MDTRPIGIIDSGSGGLSIWNALSTNLPHESIIYLGDHANAPYSDKTRRYIRVRVAKLITHLIQQNCKLCVIACNTATVAGIDWYRKQFPTFPIIGVVPVIKTASGITKTKNICILSTKFTAKSGYVKKLITDFAPDASVFSLGSSKLVSYIESEKNETEKIKSELSRMCKPITDKPIDVVILGCTHYPFIKHEVAGYFGSSVLILDSASAIARQTERIISNNGIASSGTPTYTFFTTGNTEVVSRVMSRLLGHDIVVEHRVIS
ncbi:MAG: glutamate racemase [Microgenomates group bacterium]